MTPRRVYTDVLGSLFIEEPNDRCRRINLDGTLAHTTAGQRLSEYLAMDVLTFAYEELHIIREEDEL